MTIESHIWRSVSRRVSKASRLLASVVLAGTALAVQAQGQSAETGQRDSIPLFKGVAVSLDLVGPAQLLLSDYGQYEGALRVNLREKYFPVVEVGYGKADNDYDELTKIRYKTSAPYFRVGLDVNMLKNKRSGNHLLVGLRYGFTSYRMDVDHLPFTDPWWGWDVTYGVKDERCNQHWVEAVVGVDAKVAGPFRLGWSFRYKNRLAHEDGALGNSWYVPGFGKQGTSRLGGTFWVTLEL